MRKGNSNILGNLKSKGNLIKFLIGNITNLTLSNEALSKDINPSNLLFNGNFEYWYSGNSVAPDGWLLVNGSIDKESTEVKIESYSAKLTATAQMYLRNANYNISNWFAPYKGKSITLSAWVKTSTANSARILIGDGVSNSNSSYHTGGGDWELLTVTKTISESATVLDIRLKADITSTVYYDAITLVAGAMPFGYSVHPKDYLYRQQTIWIAPDEAINANHNITGWYLTPSFTNAVIWIPCPLPTKIKGKTVVLDELIVYYGIRDDDSNTNNSGDYIDYIYLYYSDLASGDSTEVTHTDNIGDDSYNIDSNHNLIDNSTELHDAPHWLRIKTITDSTLTDIRIYGFKAKFHIKAHE